MASHDDINPMLTTNDVARMLNVHINTVRRWSNQGILKTYRIGSRGDRRFHRNDITSFLLKRSEMVDTNSNGDRETISILSSVLNEANTQKNIRNV